jgi:hypothetical protein
MPPVGVHQTRTGKQPQLLVTKIEPPRGPAGLINRPRLLGLTAQLQEKQLTVSRRPRAARHLSRSPGRGIFGRAGTRSLGLPSIETTTSRPDFSFT